MELARRRGFIWPSFEIYGGVSGFYDYGPLGASIKNRVETLWRKFFVAGEGYMELSSPTIGVEDVFVASGHLSHFVDPIVTCEKCGDSFRADHLLKERGVDTEDLSYPELQRELEKNKITCPSCKGALSPIKTFNLMFGTSVGAGERRAYLRPETAQHIFILFSRLYEFYRKKLPFGISQIGRAYRNEISPRQGLLRLREFSQAEVEVFVDPREKEVHERFSEIEDEKMVLVTGEDKKLKIKAKEAVEKKLVAHQTLAYHMIRTLQFLISVGIPSEKIRFRQHKNTEMAHYACDCWDVEVSTKRYGWVEVVGIADRTDFDLRSHIEESGADLTAFVRLEDAKEVEKTVLDPDMKKLGPVFRENAGEVGKLLGKADPANISADGSILIDLNGEEIRVEKEMFTKKNVRERVEGEKIIPHVIEPSFGIDRIIYAILESAYSEEERGGESRVVLKLKRDVAPYDLAVFSLVSKGGLDERALEICEMMRKAGFLTFFDTSGTIGRRYARADEIGIPFAVTVDFQTLEDNTVTVRDRDTMEQERVSIDALTQRLKKAEIDHS